MVNGGYQRDDARMYDYNLETLEGLHTRGPIPPETAPFFSALGAAQVFGRFTDRPFANIVGEEIGLPPLNLGYSGSGPSFFLRRPELIRRVNKGRFAVVQLMSGRSLSNSRFKVGINQGVLSPREHPESKPEFAENVYKRFLAQATRHEAVSLREEIRSIYVAQMHALLRRIKVPKILLYWADRPVDYAEGTGTIGDFWGGFPHFVNRAVIDEISINAERYVEVIGRRGLPQPLFDRTTGEPVTMWPEDQFPTVMLREHNHYYPSPEMNEDVAAAIIPAARTLADAPRARRGLAQARPRHVLAHAHIFKNAGSSIDRALQETFGSGWLALDPKIKDGKLDSNRVHNILKKRVRIRAFSSDRLLFPLTSTDEIVLHPIVLLRDPLIRTRSIYDYERSDARRATAGDDPHTREANARSFPEWVDWCLSSQITSVPISNYQTRVCGTTSEGGQTPDWQRAVSLVNLNQAVENLRCALVGTVETFASDAERWERRLRPFFPEIGLYNYAADASPVRRGSVEEAVDDIRAELGDDRYTRLADANRLDFLLRDTFR